MLSCCCFCGFKLDTLFVRSVSEDTRRSRASALCAARRPRKSWKRAWRWRSTSWIVATSPRWETSASVSMNTLIWVSDTIQASVSTVWISSLSSAELVSWHFYWAAGWLVLKWWFSCGNLSEYKNEQTPNTNSDLFSLAVEIWFLRGGL